MRVVTYGFGMRSEMRRLGAAAAVVAAVLCLGACAPEDPGPKPSPDPTSTPLFASDEEALAAAEEAYGRYQAVSDAILIDGGTNTDRLLEVATSEKLAYEEAGYEDFRANGYRSTGGSTFDRMTLQNRNDGVESFVSVYVCDDVTAVDIVGPDGVSVVASNRPDRFPRTVDFIPAEIGRAALIVSVIDEWTGENFCV